MAEHAEGFVVSFRANADEVVDASKASSSAIGNVIKAAAKLADTDAFKGLTLSAQKTVTRITELGAGLKAFEVNYNLPDFSPLTRVVEVARKSIDKAFSTALPTPNVQGFTSSVLSAATTAKNAVESLQNTKVNMGVIVPPNLEPLRAAVERAKKDISATALVTFPPIKPPEPIKIPPADTSRFTASVQVIQNAAEKASVALHSFEQVQVPAIKPPSLTALENTVKEARANIDKTFLTPLPTKPFETLDKSVRAIVAGLREENIQIPFAIQKPDVSAIRSSIEATKKGLRDSLAITIPPIDVPPIPAPKVTGYQSAVNEAIALINKLSKAAGDVTTAIKPPDLSAYKAAINTVRDNLTAAGTLKIPEADASKFYRSLLPLYKALSTVEATIDRISSEDIVAPEIQPPSLVKLTQSIDAAKKTIKSVGTFKMPEVQAPVVPPLEFRAFKASALTVQQQVAQVNSLFSGISDTPINAPSLVPFDTRPLQRAVDVSKKLLAETANLALPFIETPALKPVNTAPYLSSLSNAQKATTDAKKVFQSVSTLQLTAPVIPTPSLVPIETAVQSIRKEVSGIQLTLPQIHVPPITPIAAPKINLNDFNRSEADLQTRIKEVNALFRSVDDRDVSAPTLLSMDVRPLQQAVEQVKKQIASVKFQNIQFPKIEPLVVPPVDTAVFDRSELALQASVSAVNRIMQQVSDAPIPAPAIAPPDLRPLRIAVEKAKQDVESIRSIALPQLVLPQVPALDEKKFDASTVDLASKIKYINGLFTTITDKPINAPALIPFDTNALVNAVKFVKQQLNEASRLTIPKLATPEIPGMDVRAFDKSLTHLQQSVQLANDFLKGYGDVHLVAPQIPLPNLQPLFSAVETAKDNIKRSGAIVLPPIKMPTLEAVEIPALEQGNFARSVLTLQQRVESVNSLLHTVDTKPIIPPALLPPDTKPLFNSIVAIKETIASIHLQPITFPKILPLTVPPVIADGFNRSALQVEGRAQDMKGLLAAIAIQPLSIPTPIPPDLTPVKNFVRDVQDRLNTLRNIPEINIDAATIQPLNLVPFQNSITRLDASVVGIHNTLHQISADAIIPPAIKAPDISALRRAVEQTREQIAHAASIQLPRIEVPVVPALNEKAFDNSAADLRKTVGGINILFESVLTKPIQPPPFKAPDISALIAACEASVKHFKDCFSEAIPTPGFDAAAAHILSLFKLLNDQKLNFPLALPDITGAVAEITAGRKKIETIWEAPVASPKFIIVPPNIPPIPPLPLPPLDAANYINALKDAIVQIQNTAAKGFKLEPVGNGTRMVIDILHIVEQLQHEKIDIPFNVAAPNFSEVKKMVADVRNDLAKTSLIKLPEVKIPQIKEPALPKFFPKIVKGSESAMQATTNLGRVLQDLPFGFIGIANNLNPLLESFQRLGKESGGLKGTLKALAGSLMGAGGLGLALSAFQFFALGGVDALKKMFTSVDKGKSSFDALKERINAAKEATEMFLSTLDDVSFAHLDGAKNAQAELVNVAALYNATQNQNKAMGDRRLAVDELQKQYPAYFKNISDEAILAGKAEGAYTKLTAAIIASAKARAIQDKLVDLQKQSLDLDAQRIAAGQSVLDLAQNVRKVQAQSNKEIAGMAKNTRNLVGSAALYTRIQDKNTAAQDAYNNKLKEASSLGQQYIDIQARIAKLAAQLDFVPDVHLDPTKDLPKGEFNFFDKFFQFDPNKAKATQKEITELMDAAAAFRKEMGQGMLQLDIPDFSITETGCEGLRAARQYWKDFQSRYCQV
jgi:hypothetical protein